MAGGLTYSEIPDRAARTALQEAIESGAPADEIAQLEQEATTLSQQRDTVFKGEMLRGTLLNAYAWSTMGQIAGIAATAAFAAAAVMRSEEHTSELQSLMRTSYAVFCL